MKLISTIILSLVLTVNSFADVCNETYKDIVSIVEEMNWRVTASKGGRHNTGSKHYKGKAVDVSVKFKSEYDIILLTHTLTEKGYVVVDERIRPSGQRVWTGPHLHIYIKDCEVEETIIDTDG